MKRLFSDLFGDEIFDYNRNNPFMEMETEEFENELLDEPQALLERIDRILRLHGFIRANSKDQEKKTKLQDFLDKNLAAVSDILEITTLQALLFSYILNSRRISLKELANILQVTKVLSLKYLDDLDILTNKRLIRKTNNQYESNFIYWVPFEVIQSLREGKPFAPPHYQNLSKDEFFERLVNLFDDYRHEGIPDKIFCMDFFNLLDDNVHLEFVQKINAYSLSEDNTILLAYLCTLFHQQETNSFSIDIPIFDKQRQLDEKNELFIKNLIEYDGDDFKDKERIILSEKALAELLGITDFVKKRKTDSQFIYYRNIKVKELFYNEYEGKQIEQLTELLIEHNFVKVTERLNAQGMRTGFSCLFFGKPGTGKTETAYQIARKTGRDIMPIDISATKSYWFGESEKIIKRIFAQYQEKIKEAKHRNVPVPILLLNEADAVINKRKDTSSSSVAQTENTMQNIILEELENLDGILFATTNLMENMDTAFERRFIYKINFQKPVIDVRVSIWKNMIPELAYNETVELAKQFDFSGGQIENIARKRMINNILTGNDSDLASLVKFCREETML